MEASLLDPKTKKLLRMEHRANQKMMRSDHVESRRLETYGKWLETEAHQESNEKHVHFSPVVEPTKDPLPLASSATPPALPLPLISSEAVVAYATIEEGESLADRLRKKRKLQKESEESETQEQDSPSDVEDDLFEEESV